MLELLKLVVQPVVLERDDAGNVTGERTGEVAAVYSRDMLVKLWDELAAAIDAQNVSVENGGVRIGTTE